MPSQKQITRRTALKSGAAAIVGSAVKSNPLAQPKQPGEIRVVILAGDYWHNNLMYERHWQRILGVTGWRLMFAQTADFITPEVIDKTDLLMFSRYGGGNPGFTTNGLIEDRPKSDTWMTPEQEDSIMNNVVKRGMGIVPFHCSIANERNQKVLNLFGVKTMIMHGPMVMTGFYDMNPNHPITKGVEEFEEVDEIFGQEMLNNDYTPLFRARQNYDLIRKASGDTQEQFYDTRENFPLDRMAGWCREEGNGRIVYLNCMSSHTVFWKKSMKEIMWRSAHWAMHMDIPESGLIEGRNQDRA